MTWVALAGGTQAPEQVGQGVAQLVPETMQSIVGQFHSCSREMYRVMCGEENV